MAALGGTNAITRGVHPLEEQRQMSVISLEDSLCGDKMISQFTVVAPASPGPQGPFDDSFIPHAAFK